MDSASEKRLSQIMPQLADKARQMYDILLKEGIEIVIVQGLRTVDEQNALYAQGRTKPGGIVTNAKGGDSWHNLGCAFDAAPKDGAKIDWNASHPAWKRMAEVGRSLGLTAGADFKRLVDAPHFQLTGRFPVGKPDDEAKALYAHGGLQAVWDAIQ